MSGSGDVWNVGEDGEVPKCFLRYLYGDGKGPEDFVDSSQISYMRRCTGTSRPVPARTRTCSPHGHHGGDETVAASQDSAPSPAGHVIAIFDESGRELESADGEQPQSGNGEQPQSGNGKHQLLFWDPDVRALFDVYVPETENEVESAGDRENVKGNVDEMNERDESESYASVSASRNIRVRVMSGGRGRRGRGRGRTQRGGRGDGRRQGLGDSRWVVGHPIEEVWTNEDVPSNLRNIVMDVIRRRETRAQQLCERQAHNVDDREREIDGDTSESKDEDELYQDATDGRDNSLLADEAAQFEWSPMDSFRPTEELFTPQITGSVINHCTPYDAFRSYWDDSIVNRLSAKRTGMLKRFRRLDSSLSGIPLMLTKCCVSLPSG